jgi:putative RecB family exonuclease
METIDRGDLGMTRYSHSRIEAFRTCPKKYEFSYVQGLRPETTGIEAFMGSRVHEALEWLYDRVSMCDVPSVDRLVEKYHELWDAEWCDAVRIVREGETPEDYRAVGELALRRFHGRHAPFDGDVTVGTEVRITVDLDGTGERTLMGYIDRLVKIEDGRWEIHDYKTSKRLPAQQEADRDRQLALYQIAVAEMYPDARDVELVWHYLRQDQELRSRRTPEELEALKRDVLDDIARIESATEFPPEPSALCSWCDFRAICPACGHEARIEELPPDELREEPDVQLVDEYMDVAARARELDEEKQRIRDELVRRMRDTGRTALAGTTHRVRLTERHDLRLPAKDDEERRELEDELKDAGLWERVSRLDTRALHRLLEDDTLSPTVREVIGRYITIESNACLYPSRRQGG